MLESGARDDIIIETLDADYEDVESLNNLDVINALLAILSHVRNNDFSIHDVDNLFLAYSPALSLHVSGLHRAWDRERNGRNENADEKDK